MKTKTIPWSELPKETQNQFKQLHIKRNIAESYHKNYFGHVSSIVSVHFNGKRLVGIRGSLVSSDDPNHDWETPSDFLSSYLKTTLGNKWLEDEVKKKKHDRHEVANWYLAGKTDINEASHARWDKPNGKALALLHLAYDLFALDNAGNLSEGIIGRLRNKQNFNGARYEIFVFATLLRAGFDLSYNDEKSGEKGKVVECVAKHIDTGECVHIEAKTRNIKGVLGSKQGKKGKTRLYDKLKNAITKNVDGAYIIFVDTNFPELKATTDEQKIHKIREEVYKLIEYYPSKLPNLICFTNIPFHYGKDDKLATAPAFGFHIISKPRFRLSYHQEIISSIQKSMDKYGYIPKEFSESDNFAENYYQIKGSSTNL